MARPRKPARLWLHPKERVWIIQPGFVRTGCGEDQRDEADKKLAEHIAAKYRRKERESDLHALTCAEVLSAYADEHGAKVKDPARIGYAIMALLPFWAEKTLAEVRRTSCNDYVSWRRPVGDGTIRRELGVLSAAINFWHEWHGPLTAVPVVSVPDAPPPRDRHLTRREAAYLLAGSLGWYREAWCDLATRREHVRWRRDVNRINRHLARFILLGLYTGSRGGAIRPLQWMANTEGGWIDIDRGVLHRRAQGERESTKRKPPARLGRRILAHAKRWNRLGDSRYIVHYGSEPVASLKRAWRGARDLAYLGSDVTPHVLRHTRATWLMQEGIDIWEAAGHLGMSAKILEKVYGHHHPDFQSRAAEV